MNEEKLTTYYNKFYEEKRLKTRHGKVEFITSMNYIHKYLKNLTNPKILDIGAGMGAYSIPLYDEGYDITAVELVKHNLRKINEKNKNIKTYQRNATNLHKIENNTYDLVLLFGPMYHLLTKDEKLQALNEAKRVCRENGIIMISYIMNEYAIIRHGFMEKSILNDIKNNLVDDKFHSIPNEDTLYSFMRLEEINELNELTKLKRLQIISQDGPANYIRPYLNSLTDEEFDIFIKYHLSTCERPELLGASAHILDILTK